MIRSLVATADAAKSCLTHRVINVSKKSVFNEELTIMGLVDHDEYN